ncbi:MAG: sensor histidine kinase [Bilifractor sp.]|jgi:two-component system sensor histidine kinase YesM
MNIKKKKKYLIPILLRMSLFIIIIYFFSGFLICLLTFRLPYFLFFLFFYLLTAVILLLLGQHFIRQYKNLKKKLNAFVNHGSIESINTLTTAYDESFEACLKRISTIATSTSTLELSKRQAQYQALQNQINPHFLYNTLECIRSEAIISGLDEVGNMCEALAVFFRYTISNRKSIVSLNEELINIKNYFYIQQYRFGEQLKLTIIFEDDESLVKNCSVPKLVLQPIVENAILHGLEEKVGLGTITIRILLANDQLVIHVIDDGVGMNAETLDKLNQSITKGISLGIRSRGQGIALSNVQNRIQMIYGPNYGINIKSIEGLGTDVEIILPYQQES